MLCVTVLNIACDFVVGAESIGVQIFRTVAGTAFWGFLTYKIWRRPRQWGIGVGILLFMALFFQIYLFIGAYSSGFSHKMGVLCHPIAFAIWEIPLLVAAISCLKLRGLYTKENE